MKNLIWHHPLLRRNDMVSVLKKIGFDYVFDTNFAADLTIMEESAEVLARLEDGKHHPYPLFTSCCPGWVRFVKSQNIRIWLDVCPLRRSPQQMFGVVSKHLFCRKTAECRSRSRSTVCPLCRVWQKKSEKDIKTINDIRSGDKMWIWYLPPESCAV